MRAAVDAWDTVGIGELSEETAGLIGQVFAVPLVSIRKFRWGNSVAPEGHPHHGCSWFTIEFGDASYSGEETLIVTPSGSIIDSKERDLQ